MKPVKKRENRPSKRHRPFRRLPNKRLPNFISLLRLAFFNIFSIVR
jgi:hypothetical protein